MKNLFHFKSIVGIAFILSLNACAGSGLSIAGLSSSLLPGGFNVSGDSIDSLMTAGSKLATAARGLSDEQEYYLGRGVAAVVLTKYPRLNNPALTRYVTKVGYTMAAFSERPDTFGGYHFVILNSPEVNAVSGPGGYVLITKGFLDKIKSEDELAAVLGHEIGHIVLGHGTAAISQANLTEALTIIGKEAASSSGNFAVSQLTSAFGDSITEITNTILEKGYSRSQEYEADEYAAQLLDRSGYNQMAMVSVLQTLVKLEANHPSGGWFSTHPEAGKREEELKEDVELVDLRGTPTGAKAENARTARFKAAKG